MAMPFNVINVFYTGNRPILLEKSGIRDLDTSIETQKFQALKSGNKGKCLLHRIPPE